MVRVCTSSDVILLGEVRVGYSFTFSLSLSLCSTFCFFYQVFFSFLFVVSFSPKLDYIILGFSCDSFVFHLVSKIIESGF